MTVKISDTLLNRLKNDTKEIIQVLLEKKYKFKPLPESLEAINEQGEAYAIAFPIQGILKYHGMSDSQHRLSYFSSISLNNSSGFTVTYLKFDKNLGEDIAYLNGRLLDRHDLNRVLNAIDYYRRISGINTKTLMISRNFWRNDMKTEIGKGLGTSASGSAALATAAISILYNNQKDYVHNMKLRSIFSRYLSGSGCRSATGGISLWLSYPGIDPMESYSIRLDKEEHQEFIKKINLLTIPIKSKLKTEIAHEMAPYSPFFESWLKIRKQLVLDFITALDNRDFNRIGELAEFDTFCLHGITMTAFENRNLIAMEPDTLKVMKNVRDLRSAGFNVYCSVDTGPSVVLLVLESEKEEIVNEINSMELKYPLLEGTIGGSSKVINADSEEAKKLEEDVKKFDIY